MALSVCLYISTFVPGGAERQIVNLAGELARRGLRVTLLHAQKDIRHAHYLEALGESGVAIVNVMSPDFLKEGLRLSPEHADFFEAIPAPHALKMGMLFLAGAFSRLRPDVVHSYLDPPNCTAGCAAVLANVPGHLASFRNVDPQSLGQDYAELTLQLYRYLIARASPYFEANSRNGALCYARWLGVEPRESPIPPTVSTPRSVPHRVRRPPATCGRHWVSPPPPPSS